jgi:creatinine amidohydrolase
MTLRLDSMAWPAVEQEIEHGNRLVVVMTAATEQHGPSLPLSVDTIRADELGERIADELGCFVAPTIRPGISDHHMAFPGTISLRPETFKSIVEDYCRSLDAHGFDDIALVTTHGGNTAALEEIAPDLDADLEAHVFVAGDRSGFVDARYGAMDEYGVDKHAAGLHAGAAETSFLLEAVPEIVQQDAFERGYVGDVDDDLLHEEGLTAYTENGVLGDQLQASRSAGRTLIDSCVEYYANAIRVEVS